MLNFKIALLALGLLPFFPQSAEAQSAADRAVVRECLKNWPKAPFKDSESLSFDVLEPSVKVIGIGGKDIYDGPSEKAKLVLVKASVNVMSKSTMKLMNPKGWYCIKGSTAVLGSVHFEVDCKAQVASVNDGKVAVLGAAEKEGVAVLGSVRLKRLNCP